MTDRRGVWVPAELCPGLAFMLRRAFMERVRVDRIRVPEAAWQLLEAMEEAAATQVPGPSAQVGSSATVVDVGSSVGAVEASVVLAIGRRAVLARIHRGALPAHKDSTGAWRIPLDALEGAA